MSENLITLHRYYISANLMRTHFDETLARYNSHEGTKLDSLLYMELWYASLYVVIEGWKILKFKDNKIDCLLSSSNVSLLKNYRNCVFHFQRAYHDERVLKFIAEKDIVEWVRSLNQEFGRYFLTAELQSAGKAIQLS